jgi:hypothetical protein
MSEPFNERDAVGQTSEKIVRGELEARGWLVHDWGRAAFAGAKNDWINVALTLWQDTYRHPSRIRWLPDFLVMRDGFHWDDKIKKHVPDDHKSLCAVDVKAHNGAFGIERSALNTYSVIETRLWLPVLIVFHCPKAVGTDLEMKVIPAGRCFVSSNPRHGVHDIGPSGTPYYSVDHEEMSSMDDIFGVKRP